MASQYQQLPQHYQRVPAAPAQNPPPPTVFAPATPTRLTQLQHAASLLEKCKRTDFNRVPEPQKSRAQSLCALAEQERGARLLQDVQQRCEQVEQQVKIRSTADVRREDMQFFNTCCASARRGELPQTADCMRSSTPIGAHRRPAL